MLFKLSLKNIKKSLKDYSIYFFTLVVAVAIFYIFNSMDAQTAMMNINDYKEKNIEGLLFILNYISIFISIILGFLIIYSNNFLIKRRKKEIGLYLTLGMSKQKVSLILVMETIMVGFISLLVGSLVGIFISQWLSVLVAHMFEADMNAYHFIFSSHALAKTIMYFGVIFIFVMIFNVFTLSRYKLIDLLYANRKNESVKFRNKYITFISFILAIILIGYAYHLLFAGNLLMMNRNTVIMIVCGALGTLLFFFSLSGFALSIISKIKPLYYKDLNMFNMKQINSRINTSVISTTIISLMLLLTICILSGSISMASAFNKDLDVGNPADLTIYGDYYYNYDTGSEEHLVNFDNVVNDKDFSKYIASYVKYAKYNIDGLTCRDLITDESFDKLLKDYSSAITLDVPMTIIKYSDYASLMKLFNKEVLPLNSDQYLFTANIELTKEYFSSFYENNGTITINGKTYIPGTKELVDIGYENYSGAGNDGIVVLPDEVLEGIEPVETLMIANYVKTTDVQTLEKDFINYITNLDTEKVFEYSIRTKLQMESNSVGIKAILTFVGLYLGIIFALASVTVLAIGEVSNSSDNKNRYRVLKQIGADDKMINKALFVQTTITFMLPLIVALIHSFFGIREFNSILKAIGNVDLSKSAWITTGFMVIIYGGYFIITYVCSKRIIKE